MPLEASLARIGLLGSSVVSMGRFESLGNGRRSLRWLSTFLEQQQWHVSTGDQNRLSGKSHQSSSVALHSILPVQISSILWSTDYKQIVTGQGHPNNYIHIWQYPTMNKCHTLHGRANRRAHAIGERLHPFPSVVGHTSRILSLIMGPKGNPVVSLSADETIRFWNCFPIDVQRKKKLEMTRTHSYPTQLNFNCR